MITISRLFDVKPRVADVTLEMPLRIVITPDSTFPLADTLDALMHSRAPKVMQMEHGSVPEGRTDIFHATSTDSNLATDGFEQALIHAGTRLVLLEGSPFVDFAFLHAERIIRAGGPAVMIVRSAHPGQVHDTFRDIYANIVHNKKLDEMADEIGRNRPNVDLFLALGKGAETLLLLESVWRDLQAKVDTITFNFDRADRSFRSARDDYRTMLHPSQLREIELTLEPTLGGLQNLRDEVTLVRQRLDWQHEGGAAIPIADAMELVPSAVAEAEALGEAARQIREEATRPPRVLNANFGVDSRMLEPNEPLLPGNEYLLLIDVGPRWDKAPTLVTGSIDFPDRYLGAPKEGGYLVQIVVVSDDFEPRLSSAEMFVPAEQGRSIPIKDGKKAREPGPVRIPLRAPDSAGERHVHARVCLYYQGNLIQSGVLSATVSAAGLASQKNELHLDFALSGALRDLDNLGSPVESDEPRVAFNVTLNDDGVGGHRLILKSSSDATAAFTPYDPKGVERELDEIRKRLLGFFHGLGADNEKGLEDFKDDLFELAVHGRKLFHIAFDPIIPEDAADDALTWTKRLQFALRQQSVIQIARTGLAQYVFPWAAVYSHGLTGNTANWRYCDVIATEWPNGRRTGPPAKSCPFEQTPGDHKNTICPYGFWGLKHVVEQPLAVGRTRDGKFTLKNAATEILASGEIRLAIATTRDAALDAQAITKHFEYLGARPGVSVVPNIADTLNDTLKVVQEPEIIYFLCHGEFDTVEDKPYIGIGPKNGGRDYRIYTTTFSEWGLNVAPPNLDRWATRRPLVVINGCHTSDLSPGDVLTFVGTLSKLNAGGVIGTEVSVQLPVALEVARLMFEKLLPANGKAGQQVGETMRQVRWELANKGNLLGLAYTAYCMSSLHLVTA